MTLVYLLDLFGIFVFAVSGSLTAGRKSLDFFGVILIALVTALGGGTIRDLLLGNTPVLWVRDPVYIWVGICGALFTLLFMHHFRFGTRWLLYADAFGMALFTTLGVQVAQAKGVEPVIGVMMGVMTGTFGGLIRDVITNEIPMLLRKEIYALASLSGGVVYWVLTIFDIATSIALFASVMVILVIRITAIKKGLSLPLFHWDD